MSRRPRNHYSLVSPLVWLANKTRLDILNALRAVARFSYAPKEVRWKAALHIAVCPRCPRSYGITCQRGREDGVCIWSCMWLQTKRVRPLTEVCLCRRGEGCRCMRIIFSRTKKSVTLSSVGAEILQLSRELRRRRFLDFDVGYSSMVEEDKKGGPLGEQSIGYPQL